MIRRLLFTVLIALPYLAAAQSFERSYHPLTSGNLVQDKNFYLFTVLQQDKAAGKELAINAQCQGFYQQQWMAIDTAIKAKSIKTMLNTLKFDPNKTREVISAFLAVYNTSATLKQIIPSHLLPSGYYIRYEGQPDNLILTQALRDALMGINRILDVYGLGQKGRFPEIDAPVLDVNGQDFRDSVFAEINRIKKADNSTLFLGPSLQIALYLLHIHKSEYAALYEPLQSGENSAAVKLLDKTNWQDYPYAALVVPGNGPAGSEPLSKNGKERVRLAAENYRRKLAPFIILTGGNVHPFQTPYNEAMEMKKELMDNEHIAESSIIVEPHARHTTTNIRNANRIVYRYGFPIGKKLLITTDKKQVAKIIDPEFVIRCQAEIGHVPFLNLSSISATEIEYTPVRYSLFMDATDPLDP